jgi:hypothetical protein
MVYDDFDKTIIIIYHRYNSSCTFWMMMQVSGTRIRTCGGHNLKLKKEQKALAQSSRE